MKFNTQDTDVLIVPVGSFPVRSNGCRGDRGRVEGGLFRPITLRPSRRTAEGCNRQKRFLLWSLLWAA